MEDGQFLSESFRRLGAPPKIEEEPGPLPLGDFRLTGGLSTWVHHIFLGWQPLRRHHGGVAEWLLTVRVVLRVPDRIDPSLEVDVHMARTYPLAFDHTGKMMPEPRGRETQEGWVAHRLLDVLSELAAHEVKESVRFQGKFLVDAHEGDPFSV